jgi:hypothetical protein
VVQAATPELANEIALAAEQYRRDLAIEWLGRELPPWHELCPITADVNPHKGAGGVTTFSFTQGQPHGWTMSVQGSRERVLDSVLPHEITHTIFATHFGCPLPRWADEGACTTVEHVSEKTKQEKFLYEFLTTNRGIPFNRMFEMKQYPKDVLPLYSQGYSLVRFFIALGGKQKFIDYVGTGMQTNRWTETTQQFYGFESLSDLQLTWLEWVRAGGREVREPSEIIYASTDPAKHGRTLADVMGLAPTNESPVRLAASVGEGENPVLANATPIQYASGKVIPRNSLPESKFAERDFATSRNVGGLEPIPQEFSQNLSSVSNESDWRSRRREEEGADYATRSRPLAAESVRPTVLEWNRSERTLAPAATIRR